MVRLIWPLGVTTLAETEDFAGPCSWGYARKCPAKSWHHTCESHSVEPGFCPSLAKNENSLVMGAMGPCLSSRFKTKVSDCTLIATKKTRLRATDIGHVLAGCGRCLKARALNPCSESYRRVRLGLKRYILHPKTVRFSFPVKRDLSEARLPSDTRFGLPVHLNDSKKEQHPALRYCWGTCNDLQGVFTHLECRISHVSAKRWHGTQCTSTFANVASFEMVMRLVVVGYARAST